MRQQAHQYHDASSIALHNWDRVVMLVCCVIFFSPHMTLCVPHNQFKFVFILFTEYFTSQGNGTSQCSLANCKCATIVSFIYFCFFCDINGFFLGVLPWTPFLFNVLHMVDLSTEVLTCAIDFCKTSVETLGFFLTSLSILHSLALAHLQKNDSLEEKQCCRK